MFHRSGSLGLLVLLCGCHVSSRWDDPADAAAAQSLAAGAPAPALIADSGLASSLDAEAVAPANVDAAIDAGATLDASASETGTAATGVDAANGGDDASMLPTNVSFDTARQTPLGSAQIWQTVYSGKQADFYSFEAEAGHFYVLSTNRGTFSPDNVISLYDSEHKLIAENDDGAVWPGDAIDARLVVRLPKGGTHYVVVEDRTTPDEYFTDGFGSLYYQLMVRAIDANTPGFALENADDTAPAAVQFAQDERTGNSYVTLLGELSDGDRDLFSFGGKADFALIGDLLAPGPDGDSSTALLGRVRIASADQHAVGFIDRALGQHNIHPPMADGAYQLTISADGKPGSNGFYVINLTLLPDNPREQLSDSNNTLAMAEPLQGQGSVRRRSLVLAHLPPGDVDYYSFAVAEDDMVSVGCEGESGGSGVHALRAEVRDDHDKVLAFGTEDPSHNLSIEAVPLTTQGMRYLRLSSETAAASDAIEPWVRCVVNAGP